MSIGDRAVRPDYVFARAELVLFVHGCFWHGCPLHGTTPSTRRSYWVPKLATNKTRDRRIERALRRQGWTVVRIWEHGLRRDADQCVRRIVEVLPA